MKLSSVFQILSILPLGLAAATNLSSGVQTKSFTSQSGLTYVYDHIPAQGDNATVLLIHGYPSTRHDWHNQVDALTAAGYGIINPDLIGFGDSDKPVELGAYNRKLIADQLAELLDKECLDVVVGVGHDWGAIVLSSLAVWHADRFSKLAYLSVGYNPPGVFLDLDAINKQSSEQLGYMRFGYWYFFNSYDAAALVQENLESAFGLFFPTDNQAWGETFADLAAARSWLQANTTTPLPSYIIPEYYDAWLASFGQEGAIETAMNFYKGIMRGVQAKDEETLTDEDRTMHVPVLTISGTQDMIALADEVEQLTGVFAAGGYTAATVNTGHWLIFEDTPGVNSILLEFLAN